MLILQAIEEYGDVDVFVANFRPLKATLSGLPDRVLMKILVCATSNKVVGVHMCGDDAPEIIQVCMTSISTQDFCFICNWFLNVCSLCQGIAIAVKAGLTKQDFDATIGIHPTSAEEFVTMRSPTRKIRKSSTDQVHNAIWK